MKKIDKYNNDTIKKWIRNNYEVPTDFLFTGVALDWKGAWSKDSHRAMKKVGFISMEVLYKSHRIYQAWKKECKKQKENIQQQTKDFCLRTEANHNPGSPSTGVHPMRGNRGIQRFSHDGMRLKGMDKAKSQPTYPTTRRYNMNA